MRGWRIAAPLLCLSLSLLFAARAGAQTPVVGEEECLYLVGGPPGAAVAETEDRTQDQWMLGNCDDGTGVAVDRDRENQVQVWMTNVPGGTGRWQCIAGGSAGHRFRYEGERPALASIRVRGSIDGSLSSPDHVGGLTDRNIEARVKIRLLSGEATTPVMAVDRDAFHRELSISRVDLDLQAPVAIEIQHVLVPGREYEIRLGLEVVAHDIFGLADFGLVAGGREGATYDSVEVCTLPPVGPPLGGDLELEALLHEGRCLAGIWLPEELGGRLAEARELVQLRLDGAAASGARGVNEAAAVRNLGNADAATADGDYQRACRELGHALRALTTP